MSVDAILKEVESLSVEERAVLLEQLADRYGDPEPVVELSDEMKALLDEREAAYLADPTNGYTWETNGYTWEQVVEYVRRKSEPPVCRDPGRPRLAILHAARRETLSNSWKLRVISEANGSA